MTYPQIKYANKQPSSDQALTLTPLTLFTLTLTPLTFNP